MTPLPEPLTGPEIDCTGLSSFMLNTERLLGSELVASFSHEVIGAALLLWCRAWKQRPAASLPDDDRILASFAKLPLKRFRRLREEVLHGFIKCSDGRLYHRVLADEAIIAFDRRMKHREKVAQTTNRQKRWREAQKRQETATSENGVTRDVTRKTGQDRTGQDKDSLPNGESETRFFREKGVQGEEGRSPVGSRGSPGGEPAKTRASRKVRVSLPHDWLPDRNQREFAMQKAGWNYAECDRAAETFRLHHIAKGNVFSDINAAWEAWVQTGARLEGRREPHPSGGFGDRDGQDAEYGHESLDHWRDRCALWFDETRGGPIRERWHAAYGPAPGEPDCRCPPEVLAEFGWKPGDEPQ